MCVENKYYVIFVSNRIQQNAVIVSQILENTKQSKMCNNKQTRKPVRQGRADIAPCKSGHRVSGISDRHPGADPGISKKVKIFKGEIN